MRAVKVRPEQPRIANLTFLCKGNGRALALLAAASFAVAVSETFLLAAIVQSVSALNKGESRVDIAVGSLSLGGSVPLVLAAAALAAVLRGLCVSLVAVGGPRAAARMRERARRDLFDTFLRADWATQSADKTGHLLQTLSASVNEAGQLFAAMVQALPAAITLVFLLGFACLLSPILAGALIVFGVAVGLAMRPLTRRGRSAARADAAGRTATASHVSGVMAATAEISVLGSRQGVLDVGLERIALTEQSFARAQGLKNLVGRAGQVIAFVVVAGALWGVSVSGLSVDFATVGTIALMLLRAAGLAQQVQMAVNQYGNAAPFIEQIRTTTAHYALRRQEFGTKPFPARWDITLDAVTFSYPGQAGPILKIGSVTFSEGSFTAILGPSGSGKSTFLHLVLRLRRPTQGLVRMGGVDVHDIDEQEFGQHVAYVPQTPHLVPSTIRENIRFFRPHIADEHVVDAARRANVHEEISALPEGYDTLLDAHVGVVSGGQRQRISLARALAGDPTVLILDEPTSALDAVNEEAVTSTLRDLHPRTTVIMITHRRSTIARCDSVFVMKDGSFEVDGELATAEWE